MTEGVPPPALQARQPHGALIWFEPKNAAGAGRLFVLFPGAGVWQSNNDGLSFTPLVSPGSPQPATLKRGAFAPDGSFFGVDPASRSVWRYRNGSWTNLAASPGLGQHEFSAIAIHARDGRIVVSDHGGLSFQSRNGGESWFRVPHRSSAGAGDPPWLRVSNESYFATGHIAFDPVHPDKLWNMAGTGAYVADFPPGTAELHWRSQTRGSRNWSRMMSCIRLDRPRSLRPGISASIARPTSTDFPKDTARRSGLSFPLSNWQGARLIRLLSRPMPRTSGSHVARIGIRSWQATALMEAEAGGNFPPCLPRHLTAS